jgi:hypothetical protein
MLKCIFRWPESGKTSARCYEEQNHVSYIEEQKMPSIKNIAQVMVGRVHAAAFQILLPYWIGPLSLGWCRLTGYYSNV